MFCGLKSRNDIIQKSRFVTYVRTLVHQECREGSYSGGVVGATHHKAQVIFVL